VVTPRFQDRVVVGATRQDVLFGEKMLAADPPRLANADHAAGIDPKRPLAARDPRDEEPQ
jgi:hypothetical protein